MKKFIPFLVILALGATLVFLSVRFSKNSQNNTGLDSTYAYGEAHARLGGKVIALEVVDTPTSRALGLSGRPSIGKDQGMLFVFDIPGEYKFWMKDMNFPIDMIWLNSDLQITYIANEVSPESYPDDFGPNEKTSKYVLEVFSGFADKHNLKLGDTIELLP